MITEYDNKCGERNLANANIAPHPLLDPWVQWMLHQRKRDLFNITTATQDEYDRACRYQTEVIEALEDPTTSKEAGEKLLRELNRRIRDGAFSKWHGVLPREHDC